MAETWGSQPLDFNQDPRKVFINLLVWDVKVIQAQIYLQHKPIRAVRSIMGLIDTLDKKSKEKLDPQYQRLAKLTQNTSLVTSEGVYAIFREVLSYLHDTYLVELHRKRLEKQDLDMLETSDTP